MPRGRSIDATAVPPPDVEEAARSLAESRAVPRDDTTAARDEAGVIILQTLGDAMRGFPHVGNRIFEQLADLTDKQRLLLFWMLKVQSAPLAARCMGVSTQRVYQLKGRILARHPEFKEFFERR